MITIKLKGYQGFYSNHAHILYFSNKKITVNFHEILNEETHDHMTQLTDGYGKINIKIYEVNIVNI